MDKVVFHLQPSSTLKIFLRILHLATAGCVWMLPWIFLGKIGLIVLISLSYFQCKKYVNRMRTVWHDPEQGVNRQWGIYFIQKKKHINKVGYLLADTYKCPWFVILRIQSAKSHYTVRIPKDALTELEYRLLLQRL